MNNLNKVILAGLIIMVNVFYAQSKVAVVYSFDSQIEGISNEYLTNLYRTELIKLGKYKVIDIYDTEETVKKHKIQTDNCFGTSCLVKNGEHFIADYVFSGSIQQVGEYATVQLWAVNLETAEKEKEIMSEYFYKKDYLNLLVEVALKEMHGIVNNPAILNSISKTQKIPENADNKITQIKSSGTRLGMTFFTGEAASILNNSPSVGGYDANNFMMTFGYQFEKSYINTGKIQALIEVIPMISGIDQGLVIPSLNIMQGIRFNKSGFEFAFGPSFTLSKTAKGYYDNEGKWNLRSDWSVENSKPNPVVSRADSRGDFGITPGVLFAFGKTFQSANINVPVNAFVSPSKNSLKFGISLGFNTQKKSNK